MGIVIAVLVIFFVFLWILKMASPKFRQALNEVEASVEKKRVAEHEKKLADIASAYAREIVPYEKFRNAYIKYQEDKTDETFLRNFQKTSEKYYDHVVSKDDSNLINSVYLEFIDLLRDNPNLPFLHQLVLSFGRLHYIKKRGTGVLSIYDESAIANDIRAAVGASFTAPNVAPERIPTPVISTNAPADRLKALTELRDTGAITEEEYIAQRKSIVESI
jgi:hypothetical protein